MSNKIPSALAAATLISLLCSVTNSRSLWAAEFDYPELHVTPRASERLEMEAKKEQARRWSNYIPFQASALTTVVAGALQSSGRDLGKDPDGTSAMAGLAVGGAWLVTTVLLAQMHTPYTSSVAELDGLPRKTQREQLVRERLAEEALDRQASLMRRLTYLSVLTNLGASLYMLEKAQSNSTAMVANAVAAAFSFAPLVFRSPYIQIANEQRDYKKKIYAPVASLSVFNEPANPGRVVPGLLLSLAF